MSVFGGLYTDMITRDVTYPVLTSVGTIHRYHDTFHTICIAIQFARIVILLNNKINSNLLL